jgi:hypothetical protein
VHDLAHELGHALHWEGFYFRWKHNKVRAEHTAWIAGRELLRRLRIRVDPVQWETDVWREMRGHYREALAARKPPIARHELRPM